MADALVSASPPMRIARLGLVLPGFLVFAILCSLALGRVPLGITDVVTVLIAPWNGAMTDPYQNAIVMHARLPRTLLAAICGAGLAVSGAVLQGAFRNPLVGPQTIGTLAGAGLGGSLMLFLALGPVAVMGGAFAGGFAATLAVVFLANMAGRGSVLMLVLSGIVVSAMLAAVNTLLQYFADPERQLPQLVYWLMGSFATSRLSDFWIVMPIVISGIVLCSGYAFRLNVMASGDEEARALGLAVRRDRTILLVVVAMMSAATVSVAGVVGWVGLVVPHIARMLVGPDHRRLIPAAAWIGAAYLTLIDMMARTLTSAELPIGALTALVGAPVFVVILYRVQARGWRDD